MSETTRPPNGWKRVRVPRGRTHHMVRDGVVGAATAACGVEVDDTHVGAMSADSERWGDCSPCLGAIDAMDATEDAFHEAGGADDDRINLAKIVPPRVWSAVMALFDKTSLERLTEHREELKAVRVRSHHEGYVVTATDGWTLVEVSWDVRGDVPFDLDAVVTLEDAIACARGKNVPYRSGKEANFPDTDTILRPEDTAAKWTRDPADGIVWGVDPYLLAFPAKVAERLELTERHTWVVTHGHSPLDIVILWCHHVPPCLKGRGEKGRGRAVVTVALMPRRLD